MPLPLNNKVLQGQNHTLLGLAWRLSFIIVVKYEYSVVIQT